MSAHLTSRTLGSLSWAVQTSKIPPTQLPGAVRGSYRLIIPDCPEAALDSHSLGSPRWVVVVTRCFPEEQQPPAAYPALPRRFRTFSSRPLLLGAPSLPGTQSPLPLQASLPVSPKITSGHPHGS